MSNDLSSGVSVIYSTEAAFAALKTDGSVVAWGDGMVNNALTSVQIIYGSTVYYSATIDAHSYSIDNIPRLDSPPSYAPTYTPKL